MLIQTARAEQPILEVVEVAKVKLMLVILIRQVVEAQALLLSDLTTKEPLPRKHRLFLPILWPFRLVQVQLP